MKRHISPVQFAVGTGADWALIDVTHKCRTHLLTIHDQEMIKESAASDLAICKSDVHIFRAQLVDISDNVIHGGMVQLHTPVTDPIVVCLNTCRAFYHLLVMDG